MAGAVALTAARAGHYVVCVDLNRLFPALAFLLKTEVPPGLEQMLAQGRGRAGQRGGDLCASGTHRRTPGRSGLPVHGRAPPDPPDFRGSYGCWTTSPTMPTWSSWTDWARPTCDSSCWIWSTSRVLVAEPTLETADVLGRSLSLLNPGIPTWTVMNHTRPDSGSQAVESFETWGIRFEKDLTVPYDSRLGALIDRGWDEERGVPKPLRTAAAVLSRRLLGG